MGGELGLGGLSGGGEGGGEGGSVLGDGKYGSGNVGGSDGGGGGKGSRDGESSGGGGGRYGSGGGARGGDRDGGTLPVWRCRVARNANDPAPISVIAKQKPRFGEAADGGRLNGSGATCTETGTTRVLPIICNPVGRWGRLANLRHKKELYY